MSPGSGSDLYNERPGRWFPALVTTGIAIIAIVAVGSAMIDQARTHSREIKAAYGAGLVEGRRLEGSKAAPTVRDAGQPKAAPAPQTSDRGPLDLRGFTADQIRHLHCYLEEKPSDRRVELPPRAANLQKP
jgi:hypothetical protein